MNSEYRAQTIISRVTYFEMDLARLLATRKYRQMHTHSNITIDAHVAGRTKFIIDAKAKLAGKAQEGTSRRYR